MENVYDGREQTRAKHFILKKYLETLTFKLLQGSHSTLTYVDGFSGPWKPKASDYSDTSFMIAIRILKNAHRKFRDEGNPKEVRCFFVEENADAYKQLRTAVSAYDEPGSGFHVRSYGGKFEEAVPQIKRFVGESFALTFIDPTGWTGYDLNKITPILRHHPGEVLVNFMYDYVNRFIGSEDPKIISSFDSILGGPNWKDRLDRSVPPGLAAEMLFKENLKKAGRFKYVLSTRIEKATANRPHFALAYGTRSPAGLKAFRQVEFEALRAHERQRLEAKHAKRQAKTGQGSLFVAGELPEAGSIDEVVTENIEAARVWIVDYLRRRGSVRFAELCEKILLTHMLRETNVKDICVELAKKGVVVASWRSETPRKQKPHDDHLIALVMSKPAAP
jgi:three-Cys-motif partner protein